MSVEFSNAYQEILLDNLMAIVKQNFIFQTQIKLFENTATQNKELQENCQKLLEANQALANQLTEFENYKSRVRQNESAHEEKSRIQSALNEEMRKNSSLTKLIKEKDLIIESKDKELVFLRDYISKLEITIPPTKLKKLKPQDIEKEVVESVETGSSF